MFNIFSYLSTINISYYKICDFIYNDFNFYQFNFLVFQVLYPPLIIH